MGNRWHGLARKVGLVAAWAAATTAAAIVAWSAVARLGQVDSTASDPLTQAQVSHALAQQTPRPSTTPTRPTTTPTAPHSPSRTSASGSGGSATSPAPPPSTTPGSTTPSSTGTTTSHPPSPPRRSRSWTLNGGDVGASCQGDAVTLLYATPRDGWSVGPPEQSPTEIAVTFTKGDTESKLHIDCQGGIPHGTREEGHWGGDGGGGDGGGD